jgi:pyruvate-formate lyase
MNLWFNEFLCRTCAEKGKECGLDSFLIVLINNGDSIMFGKATAATADGRRAGAPIANANQPGAGYDQSGLTALLHSMGKLDPSLHAGVVHNLKVSRSTMTGNRAKISALLKAYFAVGGTQLMITVTDRGELEAAMKEPQEYANLVVRVGGYSDRFVNLTPDIQQEVLRRTLY